MSARAQVMALQIEAKRLIEQHMAVCQGAFTTLVDAEDGDSDGSDDDNDDGEGKDDGEVSGEGAVDGDPDSHRRRRNGSRRGRRRAMRREFVTAVGRRPIGGGSSSIGSDEALGSGGAGQKPVLVGRINLPFGGGGAGASPAARGAAPVASGGAMGGAVVVSSRDLECIASALLS